MDWRHKATCRDVDPELFQPVGTAGPALVQAVRAKLVCSACPVIAQCRDWAVGHGEPSGVWAGLSEQDRRAARMADYKPIEFEPVPEPRPAPAPRPQHCGSGHAVNEENTRVDARGRLDCRVCSRERQQAYRKRERAAGRVAA